MDPGLNEVPVSTLPSFCQDDPINIEKPENVEKPIKLVAKTSLGTPRNASSIFFSLLISLAAEDSF